MEHDNGKYRDAYLAALEAGASPAAFAKHVGDVAEIQREWHAYFNDTLIPEIVRRRSIHWKSL